MPAVTIPREPDLVLISWTRNPLVPNSSRRITAARVIGSANPCQKLLKEGTLLVSALKCLRKNGFNVVISRNTTAVSGYVLLQR